jgi:hypothetical protein
MKNLLTALAVVLAIAPVGPLAHASHLDYLGGCSFDSAPDATGSTYVGQVDVVIVATGPEPLKAPEPTVAVTDVSCELVVNGVSRGAVLTAPDGTGATAAAGPLTYTADPTDFVDLCTHATIGGEPFDQCSPACTCDPPPGDLVGDIVDLLDEAVFEQIDPTVCAVLRALAPLNDVAPDVLHVDPETGDTYLLGALFWDCPPYEGSR